MVHLILLECHNHIGKQQWLLHVLCLICIFTKKIPVYDFIFSHLRCWWRNCSLSRTLNFVDCRFIEISQQKFCFHEKFNRKLSRKLKSLCIWNFSTTAPKCNAIKADYLKYVWNACLRLTKPLRCFLYPCIPITAAMIACKTETSINNSHNGHINVYKTLVKLLHAWCEYDNEHYSAVSCWQWNSAVGIYHTNIK